MLTLFGALSSGNVYKVRLLLAQVGVSHRRIDVAQTRGEPMSEAFRALNPIGKVPAVRFDDGTVLSESGALLFYFAQGSDFWPGDRWRQTQALRWMFFEQYSHEPVIAVNRYLLRYSGEAIRHRDTIAENDRKGRVALGAMERHLKAHDWFATPACSIADIALYAYSHVADEGGFDLAPFPAVRAWLARVAEQPGHITLYQETSAVPPVSFTEFLAEGAAAGARGPGRAG